MIALYTFPTPNGHKVSIALEELELAYELYSINIAREEQFWPEFLAISPNKRIPAIIDWAPEEGGEPIPIFESGAILIHLAEKTGRLLPARGRARADVMQWLMWQMANFGPMLGQLGHFRNFSGQPPERIAYGIERYGAEAHRLYGILDRRLAEREWVAGDYSIADIAIAPWVNFREHHGIDLARYPNAQRWFEAFLARPAVQAGLEAGSERWGEPPLDEGARARAFLNAAPPARRGP